MEPDVLRAKIRALLEERGDDPVPLAEELGRGRDYLTDFLSGRKNSLSVLFLSMLAGHFRVPLDEFTGKKAGSLRDKQQEPSLAVLPIIRTAQAGSWLAVDEFDQSEPQLSTTARDPRFPRARQWLTRVSGDSVNLLGISNGDLVHCVDIDEARYQVKTGDIVEVERSRNQGADLEYSIKQVEVTDEGYLLWPRSSNAKWNKPLEIIDGKQTADMQVTMRGLVLAAIKVF